MQVQNVKSQPNFQARNLSRVVSTAENGVKSVIDVYSVDKRDMEFLDRFIKALQGQKLEEDKFVISVRDTKKSVVNSLKRAMGLEKYDKDGVLVAVSDKKDIAGILDYREHGDMNIDTLYMFKDDRQSLGRKALLVQALKNIGKQKDFYAIIPNEKLTARSEKYYNKLGFTKGDYKDLEIPCESIEAKTNKILDKYMIQFQELKNGRTVDMADVLKLDA